MKFLVILFLSAGLTFCTRDKNDPSTRIVIKVNEQELNLQRFSLLLARRLKNAPAFIAKDTHYIDKIKDEVMSQFISIGLIKEWAQKNQLSISDDELEAEVQRIRKDYPDDLSFRKFLATEGLSFSDWRSDLKDSLLEKAFFKLLRVKIQPPSETEIKTYYESNKSNYKIKERVFIRQAVVSDQVQAETLLKDSAKTDLSVLATRYSITPEAKTGGVIGWVEQGTVEEFDPLFKVPLQKVQILKSPAGFHVMRVEKKSPAGFLSLSEVTPLISEELLAKKEQAEFLAWTDRQLRDSHVFKDTALMSSLKIETRNDH